MKKILLLFCCILNYSATNAQDQARYVVELNIDYIKNTGNSVHSLAYQAYIKTGVSKDFFFDLYFNGSNADKNAVNILPNKPAPKSYPVGLLPDAIWFWWRRASTSQDDKDETQYRIDKTKPYIRAEDVISNDLFSRSEVKFDLYVYPEKINIAYVGNDREEQKLPSDDRITLKATKGFPPQLYNWKYSTDSIGWQDIPSSVGMTADRTEISFNGYELAGEDAFKSKIGGTINVGIAYDNAAVPQYIYTLYPSLTAPKIVDIEPILETCHGSGNGQLKVTFDRQLVNSDEVLYLKFNNKIAEKDSIPVAPDQNKQVLIDSVKVGTYNIEVSSAYKGFVSYTGSKDHKKDGVVVYPRPQISFSAQEIAPVLCYGGSSGAIKVKASRGGELAKFVATLTDGPSLELGPDGCAEFLDLKKGVYAINLKDENGCTASLTGIAITEPAEPVHIDGGIKPINPTGAETIDGKITFNIGGGDESYEVQVLDHNTKAPIACKIVVDKFSCTISGLGAGSFDLIVTDKVHELPLGQSCGCRVETTVTLTAPPLLVASITEHKPISCYQSNEGQLTAHATGGVIKGALMRYDYAWYNMVDMATQISSDSVARNLYQGAYRVKVTDANNISVLSEPYELFHPDSLHVDLVVQHTDCSGANGGGIQAMARGGTPPYSYQWSESGQQGSEISGLDVGFYTAIVTDSRGCLAIANAEIKSPLAIDIQSVVTQPNCVNPSGGGVELKLSGGSAPYTVLWLDNNNTDLKREGLGAGTYKATITDNKGCRAAYEFTLLDPKGFTIALPEDFTMCRNQSRTIKAVCAERDVTYKWYCDAEELAGSGNSITASRAGVYKVVATNQVGCTAQDELSVAVSNESLNLEMIAPTKVAVGTEIHAVNLSTVSAEVLTWSLPKEAIVLKRGDTEAIFMLDKAGHYEIALKGEKNGCSTVVIRTIEVVGSGDEQLPNDKKSLIKQFLVAPNPTKGYFKVQVELHREDDFTMKLYSPSGVLVDEKTGVKVQNKSFEYEINGSIQGTYLLHLITPYDKAVLQVVVKN